ncbi:unnamed protein product [Gadus morhua 'NCC']
MSHIRVTDIEYLYTASDLGVKDTFQKEGGAGRRLNLKRKKKETLEEINQSEGVEHTWSHQEDINYLGFLVVV